MNALTPARRVADPLVERLLRSGRYGSDPEGAANDAEAVRERTAEAVENGTEPEEALEAAISELFGDDAGIEDDEDATHLNGDLDGLYDGLD